MPDDTTTDSKRLLDALLGHIKPKPDTIPPGFRTSLEWAKDWGMSRPSANSLLNKSVQAGMVERRDFLLLFPCGLRKVTHYRIDRTRPPTQ